MANSSIARTASEPTHRQADAKAGLVAAGGLAGALAASSCCVLPVVLFSLGIGGAWIGRLPTLAPYQPIFAAITLGFLGYGYWLVYRKPKLSCADDAACARPLPNLVVKGALWLASAIVAVALAWPYLFLLLFN